MTEQELVLKILEAQIGNQVVRMAQMSARITMLDRLVAEKDAQLTKLQAPPEA